MDFVTMMATHLFGKKGTQMNPNGQTTGATKGILNDDVKAGRADCNHSISGWTSKLSEAGSR